MGQTYGEPQVSHHMIIFGKFTKKFAISIFTHSNVQFDVQTKGPPGKFVASLKRFYFITEQLLAHSAK